MEKPKKAHVWARVAAAVMFLTLLTVAWFAWFTGRVALYQQELSFSALHNHINEQFSTQSQEIDDLRDEIASLQEQLQVEPEEPAEAPFSHGLTAEQVQQKLLAAADGLLTGEVFGGSGAVFMDVEDMIISERYVLAQIVYDPWGVALLLSYEVQGLEQFLNINWTLKAKTDWYGDVYVPRYFQPRAPRNLFDTIENLTVRFYYHDFIRDPYMNMLHADYYNPVYEEIPGEYFWEEFIRLMFEHTGIRIWDMWLEGDKLYVDFHSTEWFFFNRGTTGSTDRGMRMSLSLASIPGISSFELLVGGEAGVWVDHFAFGTYHIENGEIVGWEHPNLD